AQSAGPVVAALSLGHSRDLGQPRRVWHPLVALVAQEETVGDLCPRAGNTDKGHRPMRVFQRKLQRGAELVRVKGAVTGLIQPPGILLNETLVANLSPSADPSRIARQLRHQAGAIAHRPLTRETDWQIRVAFARGEAVADPNDEQIRDGGIRSCHLAPADLDCDTRPIGIWHVERDRLVAGPGHSLSPRCAYPLWSSQPRTVDEACVGTTLQLSDDPMRFRIDVIPAVRADVTTLIGVPTSTTKDDGSPTILVARAQLALGGEHRRVVLLVRE